MGSSSAGVLEGPGMADLWSHTVDRDGGTYTVALFGELDMSGFDALVTVLREAAEHRYHRSMRGPRRRRVR